MTNPITVEMLKGDWDDNRDLTDAQLTILRGLTDEALEAALESAFRSYEDMWYLVLDNTRSEATDLLLAIPEGTCRHCDRRIVNSPSEGWIDPEAGRDDEDGDGIWRTTCDSHDTFVADHEPTQEETP